MRSLRTVLSAFFVVSFAGLIPRIAQAQAATPSPPARPAGHPARAPKPIAPSLPPPEVALEVLPAANGPHWTLRVKNTGSVPLRLVTDPRLLRITLPSAPALAATKGKKPAKSIICALPASSRPQGDGDARVIAPGKGYTQKLDVRTLCFSEEASRALETATRFSASYGFESKSLVAPFVVGPLDPTEATPTPTHANAKDIAMAERDLGAHSLAPAAAPVTPPASPSTKPPGDSPSNDGAIAPPRLTLSQTTRIDADSADFASLSITLKNESSRAVSLAFRPITLALDIVSPSGRRSTCNVPGQTALARDLVTTVGPDRATSQSIVLGRFCTDGTFDERGIYTVLAHVDTRRTLVPGAGSLFYGDVVSKTPTLVRVRSGLTPLVPELKPSFD